MTIRVLIVDDEPPARRKIRTFLQGDSRFEIAGEAGDGARAVELVESLRPDLLFLDIQMPELSGFEVLLALGEDRPRVVFTTAFDQYAVQAFEVRALDYLLKPFDRERFRQALDRAVEDREQRQAVQGRLAGLLADWQARQGPLERLLVREREKVRIVRCREIEWIESEEKYVRLHAGKSSLLHRETMAMLERRLDPARFCRVHRRAIVNLEFVKELEPFSRGDFRLVLLDGTRLPLGRQYRQRFMERFG